MSIKLMRRLDYWLGIPLCFLFTFFVHFSKLFLFKEKKKDIKKILFIKLSEIGSIILAYPLLQCTKRRYPQSEIFFLSFKENEAILEVLKISKDRILSIRKGSIKEFILDTLRMIKKLRKENIDVVFDLEFFSRFTAILSFLIKAKKRVGFYHYTFEGLYRGELLTHKIQYNPLIHISKVYLSFLQVIEKEKKNTPELEEKINEDDINLPKFAASEQEKEEMLNKLKDAGINEKAKLFLINLGEGNIPLREWPLENFISLSKMILEDDEENCIIIVGKNLSYKVKEFCKKFSEKRVINLAGKTTLKELLTLFEISEALICCDCGLAHLASLTSVKKFVIFGPESPLVFSPLGENAYIIYSNLPCSPCLSVLNHRCSACKDNKCLKVIKPEEVYRVVKSAV